MAENTAAWLETKKGKLVVKPAPYTSPRENEIVIKNHAVALNPVDGGVQKHDDILFRWLKYPTVLGSDVAGEVVEVGKGVTRFKPGDRVIAMSVGAEKDRNTPAEGAFQKYTVALAYITSPIPDSLSYEDAVVLPLTLSTAACGLFQSDQLALQYPSLNPKPTGQTLLIWGGSTSVGSNAIQLAVAAGYEVITTASPRNFEYVKKLGASQVFDYKSPTVVPDIITAFKGKMSAGALAIGSGSAQRCLAIVHAIEGKKFVSMASGPTEVSFTDAETSSVFTLLPKMLVQTASYVVKFRLWGVRGKFIWGSTLRNNEVGKAIFEDFLPQALANGSYIAAPEPYVIDQGLEHVEAGLEMVLKGVSAKKVVVTL